MGEAYPRILQSRWSGISKQGVKGPEQCGESFRGESVITPGSPEITGICKAALGDGKPMSPTKGWSVIDVQSSPVLSSIT